MAFLNQLLEAQRRFQAELLSKRNVVGVGLGYKDAHGEPTDQMALMALVEQKVPKEALRDEDVVPPEIDGATTDVLEVGTIRAQQVNAGPRSFWRPTIPPGVSIAHYLGTAGTFGALVYDRRTGEPLVLSNNHVLAYNNDASLGDPILQPGATDGGTNPADIVAQLDRYWRLNYVGEPVPPGDNLIGGDRDTGGGQPNPTPSPNADGCLQLIINLGNALAEMNNSQSRIVRAENAAKFDPAEATTIAAQAAIPDNPIDAALGKPLDPTLFTPEILNIGVITGTKAPTLAMPVRKMGRTTGLTQGSITVVNTTVDVNYATTTGKKVARFVGQVMTTGMSQPGDSGSLIVAQDSQDAVGLLFAGSGAVTVFTPIDLVLARLNVQITPPGSTG